MRFDPVLIRLTDTLRRSPLPEAAMLAAVAAALWLVPASEALAQSMTLDFADSPGPEGPAPFGPGMVRVVLAVAALGLIPSLLVTVTSFTRIIVVLSVLRNGLGLQQSPPNPVLTGLAFFLTLFVMQKPLEEAYFQGVKPYTENKIQGEEAFDKTFAPLKRFMAANTREQDLQLFSDLAESPPGAKTAEGKDPPPAKIPEKSEDISLRALVPAFVISELRRGFEIGFLIYLPFLVIDMAVSAVLMAMGMMMLPPAMVSLPFKLIFFVLVDGWHMLAGSLINSYHLS